MKQFKFLFYCCALVLFTVSCASDDDTMEMEMEIIPEPQPYENGLLITNEGPFNNGFGAVSFSSADLATVENNIYQTQNNGENLGNVVQSIGFDGDLAYVVANVSNRITVVNRFSFEEVARIETGLNNPRYFTVVNGKGYVTNWGDPLDGSDDYVAIINLDTNVVESNIAVVEGPELLVSRGTDLYVAHKGGFSVNDKISVIDSNSNTVVTTITVGDVPNGMQLVGEDLWVLSGGSPSFTGNETAGAITRINTNSNEVISQMDFQMTQHPSSLNVNGESLVYFLDGTIFTQDVVNPATPPIPLFQTSSFYGINVIDGKLYGCNAGDFASDGTVEVYDLASGTLETTLEVGIVPGNVYLNE